ncbi:MAG TPA: response regulator [Terriglobales bacterium]
MARALPYHRCNSQITGVQVCPLRLQRMINREECSTSIRNKILVVEDNCDIRQLLVLRLKELGYEVFEAETGLSAFRQARATCPDLILMDLGMPVIGGDEVMAWLKTDLVTRHIPIIVTTAFLFGPAVDRAIAAGAAEVVYKPFNFDALHITLQRHLPIPSIV